MTKPAERHLLTLSEAAQLVADNTQSLRDARSAIRGAAIDRQIEADGLSADPGVEGKTRKPVPPIAWREGPVNWEKSKVAHFEDVEIDRSWLQVWLPWSELESNATKPGTILFSTLASEIGADPSKRHTVETILVQLIGDAVLGTFNQVGWNVHAHRLRQDRQEYLRFVRRRLSDDAGRRFGVAHDECERFEFVSPMTIIEMFVEYGHDEASESLDLPESVLHSDVANAPLPQEGSKCRVFIESLAITIEEARAFCARHSLPVPNALCDGASAGMLSPAVPVEKIVPPATSSAARRQDPSGRRPPKYWPKLVKAIAYLDENNKLAGRRLSEIAADCRSYISTNYRGSATPLPRSRQGFEKQVRKAMDSRDSQPTRN